MCYLILFAIVSFLQKGYGGLYFSFSWVLVLYMWWPYIVLASLKELGRYFFFLLSFSGTSRRELRAGFACETIWTSCEGVPLTSSSAPLWKPVCLGFLSSLESLWINYIPRKGYILSCTWNGAEQSKNPLCLERNMGTEVETLFLCWVVTALGFAGGSRPSHGHQNSWWYSARGRPSKT